MAKINVADFYYGAVLSMLFNHHINPALVEGGEGRQVYDITANSGEYRLFIKYRADKSDTRTSDYYSWTFTLTDKDKTEIQHYIDGGYNLMLVLVCGVEGFFDSEVAGIVKHEVIELIGLGKSSITISRKKHEKAYRISVGGGRENAMQIKTNRFEELF